MIRLATPADLPRIVEMGRQHHEEAQAPGRFDPQAFAQYCVGLMEGCGVILLSPLGHLGGVLVQSYPAPTWRQAIELWWWAADGQGIALLDAFERWAVATGAHQVVMSTVVRHRGEAVGRLLRRRGYEAAEVSYQKVIA